MLAGRTHIGARSRRLLCAGVAASACFAATALAAPDDLEPNDSQANAKNVRSGVTYDANIDRLDDAQDQIPADVDWYELRVGAGQVEIAYTALQEQGGCFGPEARLFDSDGDLLGVAQPPRNGTERIRHQSPGDATLYLRVAVYQIDPCPAETEYRFVPEFNAQAGAPDRAVEDPKLKARKVQRQDGGRVSAKVRAGAGEPVDLTARGSVRLGGKRLRLVKDIGSAGAGRSAKLELFASAKVSKKLENSLDAGKKPKVKIVVILTDRAGNAVRLSTFVRFR